MNLNDINVITESSIEALLEICSDAGIAIMKIYHEDSSQKEVPSELKSDQSPLTQADLNSNRIICMALKKLQPQIPIISEEGLTSEPVGQLFWLVDPLDGTKEFIAKTDEFTVNIALVYQNKPIFGIVYAPAINKFYWGGINHGAYVLNHNIRKPLRLSAILEKDKVLTVAVSRNHINLDTEIFLNKLNPYISKSIGSSLKFCLIAEGAIDIYPRLAPTYEWDTAAGHSILEASGGYVFNELGGELTYGKEKKLNAGFIASAYQYASIHERVRSHQIET